MPYPKFIVSNQKKRSSCVQNKQLDVRSGQLIIINESFISDHGAKMCFPWEVMLAFKVQTKLHLKMTSAKVICCIYLITLLTDVIIWQTVWTQIKLSHIRNSLIWVYTIFVEGASKRFPKTTNADVFVTIDALRLKCLFCDLFCAQIHFGA